ncbi:5-amino-6-uracil reductase-like protein [Rhizodiscina lignyota]|uniref:2,5-diamino-6-ribosylamino-4(3H)-pyrimidinone 5'-phosphate reductase n=1 Tax=Rhizodiscina lignyota TaxID=1504668 RepID=A0A9P4ILP4_9PEZI|nr:5-amino-6-uracil reductase-like protein [Rhizodiscina lignyota]
MSPPPRDALHFPQSSRPFLEPYLPLHRSWHNPYLPDDSTPFPFTTLTFAQSLDSSISLAPGTQTALSGPETKAMTHYLRARHDGILVGIGTALADDPSLNCRLEGVGGYGGRGLNMQPRPVIVDPKGRWLDVAEGSKVMKLARERRGRGPWVVMAWTDDSEVLGRVNAIDRLLEGVGGKVLMVEPRTNKETEEKRLDWGDVLAMLKREGLDSLMVEGGQRVINELLREEYQELVNLVIITIAPTWLGQGGVVVSPERKSAEQGNASAVGRLTNTRWQQMGDDVVLCGQLPHKK